MKKFISGMISRLLPLFLALLLLMECTPSAVLAEQGSGIDRSQWKSVASASTQSNVITRAGDPAEPDEEKPLTDYLRDVTISAPLISSNTYSLIPSVSYTVSLILAEKTGSRFPSDGVKLTYVIPDAFQALEKVYYTVDVEINGELCHFVSTPVLYRVAESENKLELTAFITTELMDSLRTKGYKVGDKIMLNLEGTFEGTSGTQSIAFSNSITKVLSFTGSGKTIQLEKTAEKIDFKKKEVTWSIFFNVPSSGLLNAVLTDFFPTNAPYPETGEFVEKLKPVGKDQDGNDMYCLVTGLLDGEGYWLSTGVTTVPGLRPGARNISVTLKTEISDAWLSAPVKTEFDLWHMNYATLTGEGVSKGAMDEVILTKVGKLRIRKRISAEVLKKMTDAQKDGIIFTVTGTGGYQKSFTMSEMGDGLSYLLIDLPVDTYTVTETGADATANIPEGYTFKKTTYNVDDGKIEVTENRTASVTVANTYAVKKDKDTSGGKTGTGGKTGGGGVATTIEVSGTITWDDDEDSAGKRPKEVLIDLYAGEKFVGTKSVTAENEWKWSFANLERKDKDGENIRYTVRVQPISKYDTIVNGYRITNKYNPYKAEETFVRVRKVWDDNDDASTMRPESVRMILSNGTAVSLNEKNGWMVTVSNLPVYDKGKTISYTWEEEPVPGYEQTDVTVNENMTVITDTCIVKPRRALSSITPQGGITYPNIRPELPGEAVQELEDFTADFPVEAKINHTGETFD